VWRRLEGQGRDEDLEAGGGGESEREGVGGFEGLGALEDRLAGVGGFGQCENRQFLGGGVEKPVGLDAMVFVEGALEDYVGGSRGGGEDLYGQEGWRGEETGTRGGAGQTRRSGRSEMSRVGRKSREPTATRRSGGQARFKATMSATTAAWWAGGWAPVTSRRPSTTSYRRPPRATSSYRLPPRAASRSDTTTA
jgi:hypothetical protein